MSNGTDMMPMDFGNSLYGRNTRANQNMNNMSNMNNMRSMNNTNNMADMNDMNQMAVFPPVEARTGTPGAISIYADESNMPETMTNTAYIPAYLRHQIGRWMRVEFLVGNIIEEKVGQLLDVGASYLILKMLEPSTTMLCDLYSIKFITIIYDVNLERLYTR